ncbi:MAG TPA: hypothetical protein VGN57_00770 [Pirellulaceae bacterium]|jgi:hypothetical protein|nr:hypothetical protein [Pirellulaceae bacterium]
MARAFRAGALAATLVGSVAGTALAQQQTQQGANPLRDLAPTAGASYARPNWSESRETNLPATLELAAPGVQPASANQAIPSSLVPRSRTSELGQDSDFAANGSRLDWRPRLSAAERVKRQVAQRQNLDSDETSAKSNDPFRDPFGDAKAVRTVADWTDANSLRGQASPAVDRSGERRGAVVHAQAQTAEKSVLVARNNADDFPAPPAVVEEERSVAPLVPSRQQFAQGAPIPETTDGADASPLPAPGDAEEMGSPADETVEDHLRRCATAAEFARSNRLSGISLDVTPPYAPSLMRTESAPKQDPSVELADEPSRAWTNRGGSVLAEGRLVGYENGFVRIETGAGIQQIRHRDLSEEDLYYLGRLWRIPAECVLRDETLLARTFEPMTFTWKASALCHKPLYFEETQLERYGHTAGPIAQPIISGAHFFINIATLPYNMGVAPPNECQYVLGYYRPGSCAPWMIEPIPISLRGAALQAGAVVGGAAILP